MIDLPKLCESILTAPYPKVTYTVATCGLCRGSGLFFSQYRDSEMQESCRSCNGRGVITIEREA